MQPEHPAIYILRFIVAAIGEIVLAGLLYWLYARLLQWGNSRERELLGRRSIPQNELRHIGYLSVALREGQATFAAPRRLAGAGFATGFSLVLIPPLVHLVYTLAITIVNTAFMTGAPVDPRLPVSMYPWPIFRDNILTIVHYLPFLLLMGIGYGILTIGFVHARQRMTLARIRWEFAGIEVPGSWLVGIPLGGLFYFLAGALSDERTLGWLLSQYILWGVAAYAIPLYLHRMEDTLLYWFTRFDWEGRTAAAVRYILLDRFSQPSPALVEARGTDGLVLVDTALQPQDVSVFTGLVAQLPGVERVELRLGGEPVHGADHGEHGRMVLREAAALRGERRHGRSAENEPEDEDGRTGRDRSNAERQQHVHSRTRAGPAAAAGVASRPAHRDAEARRNPLAAQLALFTAGVLLLGAYFYGPAVVRHFWPERVFGGLPDWTIPTGLIQTVDFALSAPNDTPPAAVTITPGGSLVLLTTEGRLWTWTNAGPALAQGLGVTEVRPDFQPVVLPTGERITHVAPAPDGRLLAATATESHPADELQTLAWIDLDSATLAPLPRLSRAPLPGVNPPDAISLVRLVVDHTGRPYAAVEALHEGSAVSLVLGLFSNRWQVVFTGPELLDLVPSYQSGLPLIALTGEAPYLLRLGYRRASPLGLRRALPPDEQWTGMATTAERYLTLFVPDGTLLQVAPDGHIIAHLKAEPGSEQLAPARSSPPTTHVMAWSDPETGSEWVGIAHQGRLRVYQPSSVGRLVRLAYRLEAEGQLAQATDVWLNVLRIAPTLPQAHLAVGKAYFEQQNWADAAREFYHAGEVPWLERALANLDSQSRRGKLLVLLFAGVALEVLSVVISFLGWGRRDARRTPAPQ